jgi:hypothetical protein
VKKTTTAHGHNILHVNVLYNIKRKKYKTVCAELAFDSTRGEHANHYATDGGSLFLFYFY